MRTKILNNKNRIKYLMDQNNIKTATELAKAMYTAGILQAKKNDDDFIQRTARTINLHLDNDSLEKLSGVWIKRYCDFFHCSADYLLGYISQPTHEISNVADVTGLSREAIVSFMYWKTTDDQRKTWNKNISDIVCHPEFSELMKHVSFLLGDSKLEAKLLNKNLNPSDTIDSEIVDLWNASRIFTNILEGISADARSKSINSDLE